MSLAEGMKNFETRYSRGFCCECNEETNARWERFGKRLLVSCEGCGVIYTDDENYFKEDNKEVKNEIQVGK